jgi:hypothetical protein
LRTRGVQGLVYGSTEVSRLGEGVEVDAQEDDLPAPPTTPIQRRLCPVLCRRSRRILKAVRCNDQNGSLRLCTLG